MSQRVIKMHPTDNVAVVVAAGGLPAGMEVLPGLLLVEPVPQGHKVALAAIAEGSAIVRYGVTIGFAKLDITAGSWVNENIMTMPAAVGLDNLPIATRAGFIAEPLTQFTFEGYRNADGTVGTRNILAISQTVQCVAGVVDFAVKRIREELLPKYPNVDGVVALAHTYGCGVAIDAPSAPIPIRTVRNIALNPNFGGEVMIVSLGCEKMQPARLMPKESIPATLVDGPAVVCLQDEQHVGFMSMIESIMQQAEIHLTRLNQRKRETCPASTLVVGMQCGGSDAFSGITANPALGFAADLLVRAGATVMFSENTEVRDGIDQLTSRAVNAQVADAIIKEMEWYDNYLAAGMVDRSANTTPGNKKGGLSNIVEKAMGSIVKSGSSPIVGVLSPGERLSDKGINRGLVYSSTPASDFICGTLQLAAGMNLHIFTTGRGTPYGLAECPVIKVATRTELAQRWHDLMDVNAGRIAEGEITIEELGWEIFHLMLDVASGRKTWAEKWKLHNALVLFNPAPIT
ncbi:galactarate dehydratase [Cellvibrio sp. PSBB023]|uniref:galactarate dehydratase n=1 Tax=Cellvibrio sp. PSBB023 TaxID=1945512 RepID=UPI00098ED8AF|nr:galactarate dehydratase [Cellvibrio sp. PSBB023]AQT62029.1 galactarate dehydratase [Cellvibrio sp. PSBB023]